VLRNHWPTQVISGALGAGEGDDMLAVPMAGLQQLRQGTCPATTSQAPPDSVVMVAMEKGGASRQAIGSARTSAEFVT